MLCYLTRNNDTFFTLYKYSLGNGGFAVPSGITTCFLGDSCSSSTSAMCYAVGSRGIFTANPSYCGSYKASYSTCTRTVCNGYAAKAAEDKLKSDGWHLIKSSDLADLKTLSFGQQLGLAGYYDPFCIHSGWGYIPYCSWENHDGISWPMHVIHAADGKYFHYASLYASTATALTSADPMSWQADAIFVK